MPLSAVLLSGVRMEDSGAAAGAMQASQQLGAALGVAILVRCSPSSPAAPGARDPETFSAGAADAFIAATAEGADGGDELFDVVEGSASDGLAGDDSEEDLDGFSQEPEVGVKCSVIRGCFASHWFMSSCLWVW